MTCKAYNTFLFEGPRKVSKGQVGDGRKGWFGLGWAGPVGGGKRQVCKRAVARWAELLVAKQARARAVTAGKHHCTFCESAVSPGCVAATAQKLPREAWRAAPRPGKGVCLGGQQPPRYRGRCNRTQQKTTSERSQTQK